MCLDLGKCKDGKCIPFCEREQQLESCACNGEHVPPPPPEAACRSLPLGVQGCVGTGRPPGSGPGSFALSAEPALLVSLLATFSDLWPVWGRVGGNFVGDGWVEVCRCRPSPVSPTP